jgi:hypothetical protein
MSHYDDICICDVCALRTWCLYVSWNHLCTRLVPLSYQVETCLSILFFQGVCHRHASVSFYQSPSVGCPETCMHVHILQIWGVGQIVVSCPIVDHMGNSGQSVGQSSQSMLLVIGPFLELASDS